MGKLRMSAVLVAAVSVLLVSCGDDDDSKSTQSSGLAPFYAGQLSSKPVAVGIALTDDDGTPMVQAYAVDGNPGGVAEWFSAELNGKRLNIASASGHARLDVTFDSKFALGTIMLGDGKSYRLATRAAHGASGIYDVSVDTQGHYTGTSINGDTLDARQTGNRVTGALTTRQGERFPYSVVDMSRVLGYPTAGGAADRYLVVVTARGAVQVGRSGAVKTGAAGNNFVTLDLPASDVPVPGVFFGRLATGTDLILVDVGEPNGGGVFQVRAYLSDGEPEPAGDIEWFTAAVADPDVDITSVTGDARLRASIGNDSVSGTVSLPGVGDTPFFAAAAGDGAGIYDVTIGTDGVIAGTSDTGASLEYRQNGLNVVGTITTADGRHLTSDVVDLTRAFSFDPPGNVPDTYVAFAAPAGRWVVGRSGAVRIGSAGLEIIGLDKKEVSR